MDLATTTWWDGPLRTSNKSPVKTSRRTSLLWVWTSTWTPNFQDYIESQEQVELEQAQQPLPAICQFISYSTHSGRVFMQILCKSLENLDLVKGKTSAQGNGRKPDRTKRTKTAVIQNLLKINEFVIFFNILIWKTSKWKYLPTWEAQGMERPWNPLQPRKGN